MLDPELLRKVAIRAGPSQRFLERLNGERFFLQADTAWELGHRCTREEVVLYLDARKSQGFNAVLMVLIPELDCRNGQEEVNANDGSTGSKIFYPNRYGQVPLLNDDPTTPNPAYFEHIDWVVEQMVQRDILPILVPTWGRYINTSWNWGPILFNPENARAYGEHIGKRYPFCPKLLGGDINTEWVDSGLTIRMRNAGAGPDRPPPQPWPTLSDIPRNNCLAVINSMAEGVLCAERLFWEKPMLSYHPGAFWLPEAEIPLPSAMLDNPEWLALDTCQSGHHDGRSHYFKEEFHRWDAKSSWEALDKMWNAGIRPIIDLESHYEGAYNCFKPVSRWKWGEHDIRSGAWQSLCSGACGIVYGVNSVWQMWDPERARDYPWQSPYCGHDAAISWQSELDLAGTRHLQVLHRHFLSLPEEIWSTRRPAQELLVHTDAPEDVRLKDGRVDVMTNNDTTWVLAHTGQGYSFTLNLPEKKFQACWLDPRTGDKGAQWQVSGKTGFNPPRGGSVAYDWVLELYAE